MPAQPSLAALLDRERQTRIVVRCGGDLVNELQAAAETIGASRNQLAKALIRDGLARLAAGQTKAA